MQRSNPPSSALQVWHTRTVRKAFFSEGLTYCKISPGLLSCRICRIASIYSFYGVSIFPLSSRNKHHKPQIVGHLESGSELGISLQLRNISDKCHNCHRTHNNLKNGYHHATEVSGPNLRAYLPPGIVTRQLSHSSERVPPSREHPNAFRTFSSHFGSSNFPKIHIEVWDAMVDIEVSTRKLPRFASLVFWSTAVDGPTASEFIVPGSEFHH
jgi:hypothetical protein